MLYDEWCEPGSIRSSYGVIVQMRVRLERAVIGDLCFENRRGSHHQFTRVIGENVKLRSLDCFVSWDNNEQRTVHGTENLRMLTYYRTNHQTPRHPTKLRLSRLLKDEWNYFVTHRTGQNISTLNFFLTRTPTMLTELNCGTTETNRDSTCVTIVTSYTLHQRHFWEYCADSETLQCTRSYTNIYLLKEVNTSSFQNYSYPDDHTMWFSNLCCPFYTRTVKTFIVRFWDPVRVKHVKACTEMPVL